MSRSLRSVRIGFLSVLLAIGFVVVPTPSLVQAVDPPVVKAISITAGPVAGGYNVSLTGTGFTGVTGVTFGGVPGSFISVISSTSLRVQSPPHKAGTVDIKVTTKSGTSKAVAAAKFKYVSPPKLSKLSVKTGGTQGGTKVTITGSGFSKVRRVWFGGTPGLSLTVISSKKLTVFAPPRSAGVVDVEIDTNYARSAVVPAGRFTYLAPPFVSAVSPKAGSGKTKVTLTGANFSKISKVLFGGVAGSKLKVSSPTSLTVTAPKHAAGTVPVQVIGAYGWSTASTAARFTYDGVTTVTPAANLPKILGMSTASVSSSGYLTLTLTGENFTGATKVLFGSTPGTSLTVSSATSLSVEIPAHKAGSVDVRVVTPKGTSAKTAAGKLKYVDPPKVKKLSVKETGIAGLVKVTITGTGFTEVSRVSFGSDQGLSLYSSSSKKLTVIAPAHPAGQVYVRVVGKHGSSAEVNAAKFAYYDVPTITAVSPNFGSKLGGTTVTITGTNLHKVKKVLFDGVTVPKVKVTSDTSLTFPTPKHVVGQVNVQIVTTYGTSVVNSAAKYRFDNIVQIDADKRHACAVYSNGGVKCWGANEDRQLGDGTTTNRYIPTAVSGLSSGVKAISAGGRHTCALLTTEAVKCWGSNKYGYLGDGTTTDRLAPVNVSGLSSGVKAITVGSWHTCALLSTGAVKCWGDNYDGQLGDGTTTDRLAPVNVSGLSDVAAISAGDSHTCALLSNGGVKCWGRNSYGELGNGTRIGKSVPVSVSGLTSGVVAITAGSSHHCALLTSGGVKCWGLNEFGQIGDGTLGGTLIISSNGEPRTRLEPVSVSGLASGVSSITAGGNRSCALLSTGAVKCWGFNTGGAIGDGTTKGTKIWDGDIFQTARLKPVLVVEI